jgi:uncharacterized membrane protein
MAMCSAWLIFLLALALHGSPSMPEISILALVTTVVAFGVMAFGGWLGGKLVYKFGVGRL